MGFGKVQRQELKSQAKQMIVKNIRYCITASAILALISITVELLKTVFSAYVPDFLGIHSLQDFSALYTRLLETPLEFGQSLWNFYLHHFLYEQLAVLIGVLLEAPILLAFMAGLYRIGVHGEAPERRTLGSWYTHTGLTARAIGLLFFLDVFFEVLQVILVLGPTGLMMVLTVQALASGAALLPIWVPLLPLLSIGGLVLSIFLYARWFPALHFLAKYPHLTPWGALRKSGTELKGHRREYIVLILSFLPWLLLEALTYGAAGIYVIPYLELTVTLFLEKIRLPEDPPPEEIPE